MNNKRPTNISTNLKKTLRSTATSDHLLYIIFICLRKVWHILWRGILPSAAHARRPQAGVRLAQARRAEHNKMINTLPKLQSTYMLAGANWRNARAKVYAIL